MVLPNMMHAMVLRSQHPHAEIISIDTREAEAMGAVCLTYADINPVIYNERSVSVPSHTYRDRTVLPAKARHFGRADCRRGGGDRGRGLPGFDDDEGGIQGAAGGF